MCVHTYILFFLYSISHKHAISLVHFIFYTTPAADRCKRYEQRSAYWSKVKQTATDGWTAAAVERRKIVSIVHPPPPGPFLRTNGKSFPTYIRISRSFSLNLSTHTAHQCPSIRRLRRRYLSRRRWPFNFRCCPAVRSSYLLNWEKPIRTLVEKFGRKIADVFRQQLRLCIINDTLRRHSLLFLCFVGLRICNRTTRHYRVSHAFLFPRAAHKRTPWSPTERRKSKRELTIRLTYRCFQRIAANIRRFIVKPNIRGI